MELKGALSNPRPGVESHRLGELHTTLTHKAATDPRPASPAPRRICPVLETVTLVLEHADRPMHVSEIHATAEERLGGTLLRTSVKAALAAGSAKDPPHFKRVRHGLYSMS